MSVTLRTALEQLQQAAAAAGLDPAQARQEGLQLSATIAEPARGAFRTWGEETGEPGGAEAFFDAASRGRRFRSAPTVLMSQLAHNDLAQADAYAEALAQVATAACLLGEPHPQVTGNATLAASAQRSVLPSSAPASPDSVPSADQPHSGVLPPVDGPGAFPGLPTGSEPAPAPAASDDQSWLESMAGHGRDAAEAMGDFTKRAPGILSNVLGQLRHTQQRMAEAGMRPQPDLQPLQVNPFDLTGLDPHSPGAFPGITATPAASPAAGSDPAAAPAPAQAAPSPEPQTEPEEPQEPAKSVEELLAELDELVGLQSVKEEIHRQSAILRVQALRSKAGLKDPTITRHLIFVGNPGTGKTTIARLVAGIYRALGLLSKGQLVEVDRSELVAGYLGQTAIKTAEVCKKATGGVLFIDEAYSLSGDQYGEEAINTLVKEMEDNRHDLVVIVAGYPRPMATFIDENPGLSSRFRTTIEFTDYSDDELVQIFTGMAEKADYDVSEDTATAFRVLLAQQGRDESFGNGRFARNTLEAAIGHQAWRLRDVTDPSLDQLRELLPQDLAPTSEEEAVPWEGAPTDDAPAEDAPAEDAPTDDAPADDTGLGAGAAAPESPLSPTGPEASPEASS